MYIFWHKAGSSNDRYNPMPSEIENDLSNLYFHWDIMENYNYVCERENVLMNSKSGTVKMKEYGLNDMKMFRLNDVTQHCKIWFSNDGMNIIPMWCKRLLVELVMFY
jgi:hypothetical protein